MLPVVVAAMGWGSPFFDVLAALFAGVMAWEWETMARGRFGRAGIFIALVGMGAILLVAHHPVAAVLAVGGGAAVVGGLKKGGGLRPAIGLLYIAWPCTALVWLRAVHGWETMLWLFLVVWATDTGAYGVGRWLGGPRLAPTISPGKTWSGAVGGLVAAMGTGGMMAGVLDLPGWWIVALISVGVSGVAQSGDLIESKIKRHFGVKDSGWIIPGHGGVFDRVDGILAAAPVVAGAVLISGGGIRLWGS